MPYTVSVRLDDESRGALTVLESQGLSRSEAIRQALVEAAARRRPGSSLAAEATRLGADDRDAQEMARVAAMMGALRARG